MTIHNANKKRKRALRPKRLGVSHLRGMKLTIDAIMKAARYLDEYTIKRQEYDHKVVTAIFNMTPEQKEDLLKKMQRGVVWVLPEITEIEIIPNDNIQTSVSLASDYNYEQIAKFYGVPKEVLGKYPKATFHINPTS